MTLRPPEGLQATKANDASRHRVVLRAAAAELGVVLADTTIDALLQYVALMLQWNRVYNLTALRDPDEMLSHHLMDCVAILPALQRHAAGARPRILDVGSGGGLPGVVIAIVRPDWEVTCVDAVAKKASFIRQVGAVLGLRNLHPVHARVEALGSRPKRGEGLELDSGVSAEPGRDLGFDLITSRAFASLSDFVALTRRHLACGGVWLAMKGKTPNDEIAALTNGVEVFHVEQVDVPGLEAQRCLVWLRPESQAT